ncbi:MAG: hypothetical protein HW387_890 [Parachlamydiales bacterium]|nr:hypothetical protein [Parachlamydiales bacterium]
MTPPIDRPNHLEMLIQLLSLLEPLAAGNGMGMQKMGGFFQQAFPNLSLPTDPGHPFQRKVEVLQSLQSVRDSFVAGPHQISRSVFVKTAAANALPQHPLKSELSRPLGQKQVPTSLTPQQSFAPIRTPARFIQHIQSAIVELQGATTTDDSNWDAEIGPMVKIAARLCPAIIRMIAELESEILPEMPTLEAQIWTDFAARMSNPDRPVPRPQMPFQSEKDIALQKPIAGEGRGEAEKSRFTPTSGPALIQRSKEPTALLPPISAPDSSGFKPVAPDVLSPSIPQPSLPIPAIIESHSRSSQEPAPVPVDGRAIPIAMPFTPSAAGVSSYSKRKKDKNQQREEEEKEERSLPDYSELI